jgi:hypothetical protein
VEAIIDVARRKAQDKHDIRRLARVLLRVWEQKTLDILVVGWTHLDEHKEVLRRIYEYTSLPFRVIVSANSDQRDVIDLFGQYRTEKDNFTLVRNGYNTFVGPGTNRAMDAGTSDIAIYVCGREGFALQPGWEIPFVHHMEENPEVGLAGTLCHSPSYLTGAEYQSKIPLFSKFRNQSFAASNPDRTFKHVQGGIFAVRRKMYDAIGGFSDEVPHEYTDVEYSFYAESRGWQLGEVSEIVSLYNKTRPPLAARIDETTMAAHPPKLDELAALDAIARREHHNCNLCGWHGTSFEVDEGGEALCPRCRSKRADRTVFRWLTPSTYLYRRLPAIAVGLDGPMERIWREQFQGPRLASRTFIETIRTKGKLPNGDGSLHVGAFRGPMKDAEEGARIFAEFARLLRPGGILLLQATETGAAVNLLEIEKQSGFAPMADVRYASHSVQFDWVPLHACIRAAGAHADEVRP